MGVVYNGRDNLDVMTVATNYNEFLVREIVRNRQSNGTIVDFGAGNGYFPTLLKAKGLNVLCVEQDPVLSAAIQAKNLTCFHSLGEMKDSTVDYIYSLNVLEHIEDDQAVLKEMFRCLKPGARVYIYVPAFQILYSSMDKKVGHIRRYRVSRLSNLARQTGLEIERMNYCDSIGFVMSLLYKWFGNSHGDINVASIKIYDRLIFPVSHVLDFFVGKLFGKNIGAVLRKPLR
jgi:SAM-dependent methyltransferase